MNTLACVGAGCMASAIIKGILESQVLRAEQIRCMDGGGGSAHRLAKASGIVACESPETLLKGDAGWVLLACKPQQLKALSPSLPELCKGKILLSILAGIPLKRLGEQFATAASIIRAMPNTPAQIQCGITAWTSARPLNKAKKAQLTQLLSSIGEVLELPESQLDAFACIAGSGPAYVFAFAEALMQAAKTQGLSEAVARKIVPQTLYGAAELMRQKPASPATHIEQVASKGGITEAAMEVLKQSDFKAIIAQAVDAAAARNAALSKL